MIRLLTEPFSAPYMQRALVEAVMLGVLGGIVGVHVILRRLEFMADALTHTVFPGMAAAFVVGGSLYVGALVTGAISAVLLTMLTRKSPGHFRCCARRAAHRFFLARRHPDFAITQLHRGPHRALVRSRPSN